MTIEMICVNHIFILNRWYLKNQSEYSYSLGLFKQLTMKINIDKLTEAELIELNQKIVERLRFFNQARAHVAMLEFKIGCYITNAF